MILTLFTALAGGYFFSDSGVVASGRGGAFVAGADTQFAQYYNPAGLIHIENTTFNVGFTSVQQHVTLDRLREDGSFFPPEENHAPAYGIPQGGVVLPLIKKKLVLAAGFVSPFAPSSDYSPTGSQRYSIVKSGIIQFSVGPSVAYRPIKLITFGLGLQWKLLGVQESVVVSATGQDDTFGDIAIHASAVDVFTPNFNLGILLHPAEAVTIGIAFQPETRFQARGSATMDLSAGGLSSFTDRPKYQDGDCTIGQDDACAAEDGIGINLTLPHVLRVGVAVRPVPHFEIEAAFVWQNWKVFDKIRMTGFNPEVLVAGQPAAIPESVDLPAGLRNTASYRLGAEWRATRDIEVRAGGFYETGSVTNEAITVSLVDPDKVQLGGGISLYPERGRVRLDASAAGVFFPTLQIRNSTTDQVFVDALGLGGEAVTIGNGDIRSTGWLFGLQASVILGERP